MQREGWAPALGGASGQEPLGQWRQGCGGLPAWAGKGRVLECRLSQPLRAVPGLKRVTMDGAFEVEGGGLDQHFRGVFEYSKIGRFAPPMAADLASRWKPAHTPGEGGAALDFRFGRRRGDP